MLKRECKGLESRIELADELVQQYKDKIAPFIVWIMGSHGSGKSFVINNVLKKLENFPHMALYISLGERFIKYGSKTSKKELNSLSFSMGNQLISLGFGIGWENNNSTYNHIRNMLSNILRSDVIICVDDFSNADSEIRAMVLLIAKHFKELQEEFKVKIYMLLTDIDSNHIFNTSETIAEYVRSENLPKATDETILRLRIIYDIAPCVLDCLNQYDSFQCLYEKSKELSQRTHNSQKGRNLGLYIENVFNRKAFLFVNQTQCGIYYHKAKRYFKENEIWDEYCITLVCEAGTDIVIQQYEEALKCCNSLCFYYII